MQAESERPAKPSCEHRCAERYPGPRPSRRQEYTIFGGDADDARFAHRDARIDVFPLPGGPCMRRIFGEEEEAEGAVAKAMSLWIVSSWDWRGVRRGGRRAASSSSSSESAGKMNNFRTTSQLLCLCRCGCLGMFVGRREMQTREIMMKPRGLRHVRGGARSKTIQQHIGSLLKPPQSSGNESTANNEGQGYG
jgi:hypothetical protein